MIYTSRFNSLLYSLLQEDDEALQLSILAIVNREVLHDRTTLQEVITSNIIHLLISKAEKHQLFRSCQQSFLAVIYNSLTLWPDLNLVEKYIDSEVGILAFTIQKQTTDPYTYETALLLLLALVNAAHVHATHEVEQEENLQRINAHILTIADSEGPTQLFMQPHEPDPTIIFRTATSIGLPALLKNEVLNQLYSQGLLSDPDPIPEFDIEGDAKKYRKVLLTKFIQPFLEAKQDEMEEADREEMGPFIFEYTPPSKLSNE